ncbi:MAG: LysM domain-containing protein [Acutalibacteraceae bacterium]|nr:LysM domain-containing protein [Acutalibacteraceae bacterium]
MKHGIMRFMGYTLYHNPHTLTVTSSANILQQNVFMSTAVVHNVGNNATIVKGEGVFYGESAFEQYMQLKHLYNTCKAGVLSVSDINPMYAYLSELKLKCTPVDDYVEYTFAFTEVSDYIKQENSTAPTHYIVQQNEDLWDIACKLDIPIEALTAYNTQIKCTYSLAEGDVIKINDI